MNPYFLSLAAVVISFLAIAAVAAGWWHLRSLNRLRKTFFAGANGQDLEQVINTLAQNFNQINERQAVLEQALLNLKSNFNFAVQKIGIVRFNPFADGGGNFSFSLALLNGQDSGVVITSMHGREQNRIYTKKILEGKSETGLTEEERQAVDNAQTLHNSQIIKF